MSFSDENEKKRLLKEQPFYNVIIEKSKIKKVNNVDMLSELLFYDELSIVKTAKAFRRYTRTYIIEIMEDKAQLEASKPVIKDLFRYLLIEIKCFIY